MGREYFCCYHSYRAKTAKLSDQELGRLFRALIKYSETGERQDLAGRESIAFDFIADDIDRASEKYNAICAANSENGKKGGRTPKAKKAVALCESEKSQYKDKDKDKDKEKESTAQAPTRHAHGTYGHVLLTDAEYERLVADIGITETKRCITYIDESAQSSGNKNRWKDWNLVVRRCSRGGWGKKKQNEKEAFLND